MNRRYRVPAEKVPHQGERSLLSCDGRDILLFNVHGSLYAIDDQCPHQGASLFSGRLEGSIVECCAHGLRFNIATGFMLNSCKVRVANHQVECDGEQVTIVLSEAA